MRRTDGISPVAAVLVGLVGLAAAIGIGRFAFTPLLPLMQQHAGVTLAEAGWLAAANYAGYLAGALLCLAANFTPRLAARGGLAGVAVFTLAMGLAHRFVPWLLLRFLAGVASAMVLVGVSAWALASLAHVRRPHWAGFVFAGVGAGIVVAGLVALIVGMRRIDPAVAWLALGAMASVVAVFAWPLFAVAGTTTGSGVPPAARGLDADDWRLVICYGVFGFGYIIPATFLPSLARGLLADPAAFGWTWPVFGAAAAVSTVGASLLLHRFAPRRVWAWGHGIMAAGVAAPVLSPTLPALLFSAVCIGGTFMIVTMAGLQEARRIAGASAARIIAAMTAAFALGQMLGPMTVSLLPAGGDAMRAPSVAAAVLLLASAAALLASRAAPVLSRT